MSNTIIPNKKEGRPTVMTDETIRLLQGCIMNGLSVKTACEVAEITTETFYKHLRESKEFADIIRKAKNSLKIIAGQRLRETLQDLGNRENGKMVRWYLERAEPELYGNKVQVEGTVKYVPPTWFTEGEVVENKQLQEVKTDANTNVSGGTGTGGQSQG